jgi:hypothetical protein
MALQSSHTRTIFDPRTDPASIVAGRGPTLQSRPTGVGFLMLGANMWIVMYVAMIASLSAMGFAVVPESDRNQMPHDDV